MKITIELNLENEDDLHKYKLIYNAAIMFNVLDSITTDIRDIVKHGGCSHCNLTLKSNIEDFQDYFYQLLKDENLDLDKIY